MEMDPIIMDSGETIEVRDRRQPWRFGWHAVQSSHQVHHHSWTLRLGTMRFEFSHGVISDISSTMSKLWMSHIPANIPALNSSLWTATEGVITNEFTAAISAATRCSMNDKRRGANMELYQQSSIFYLLGEVQNIREKHWDYFWKGKEDMRLGSTKEEDFLQQEIKLTLEAGSLCHMLGNGHFSFLYTFKSNNPCLVPTYSAQLNIP